MPEGDTIWRAARTLHAALAGQPVLAIGSSLPAVAAAAERLRVVGQKVEVVEARAGIGNVYKSEVLFACGVSPFARVRDLDDGSLGRLAEKAGERAGPPDLLLPGVPEALGRLTPPPMPPTLWESPPRLRLITATQVVASRTS